MGARHDFEQNFAIIIGINSYQKKKPLRLAVPDAELLGKILSAPERGEDEVYKVLLLKDEQATHSKLKTLLNDLDQGKINISGEVVDLKENHRLLFYFSGHGYASNRETDQADENEQYLLPQDGKKLPMQELTKALGKLPCRHVLLILDCCYSGAVRGALGSQDPVYRTVTDDNEMSFRADYDRMWKRPTFTVITSAGYELALDFDNEKQENSYFAMALRDALECKTDSSDAGSQKSDFNKDGIITEDELCTYLKNSPQVILRQSPQIYRHPSSKGRQGGQYIFLLPDFEPSRLKSTKGLESPYKGLLSYEQEDASIFFGRRRFVDDLFDRVYNKNQKLTVVIGVSGSGKSSLVKAGLIPRLQKGKHEKSWVIGEFRPGNSPFEALFAAMKKCLKFEDNNNLLESQVQAFHEKLGRDIRRHKQFGIFKKSVFDEIKGETEKIFNKLIKHGQVSSDKQLLLVIDQFEELITLCQASERELFLKLLKQMLDKAENLQLVLTVRADFEVHFRGSSTSTNESKNETSSDLSQYWDAKNARLYVDKMSKHELKKVIERPAALLYVDFESDELVDHLIEQVNGMPGALPLLSLTLDELYQKAKDTPDKKITKEHYKELGSVVKVVTDIANREYNALSTKEGEAQSAGQIQQEMVRLLMLRMVSLQGGQLAKRPVHSSELEYPQWRFKGCKNASSMMEKVCNKLKDSRLIVKTEEGYIEPAHDALILHWDKLQEWIDEEKDRFDLVLRDRLIRDVHEWQEQNGKERFEPTTLIPISQPVCNLTAQAFNQLVRCKFQLSQLEKRMLKFPFILSRYLWNRIVFRRKPEQANASITSGSYLWHNDPRLEQLRPLLYAEKSWLNVDETKFVRRSVILKEFLSTATCLLISILFVVLLCLWAWAWYEQKNAQIREAEALRESAEANLKSGRELEATLDILEAQKILSPITNPFQAEKVESLNSSVRGTFFKLLYGTQERNRLQLDRGSLYEVDFNPNPEVDLLATVGQGDIVRLWNSKGEELAPLITGQEDVYSVAFGNDPKNPESILLATGGIDGTVKFWEIQEDGSTTPCKPDASASSNSSNQNDGGSSTSCSLQSIETSAMSYPETSITQISNSETPTIIDDIEFSDKGQLLAIVEQDFINNTSHVKLWELKNGQYISKNISSRQQSDEAKTQQLGKENVYWDIAFNPQQLQTSKDEQLIILATVGEGDVVKLWNANSGDLLREINTEQGNVYSVAFSHDGILMTGGSDGIVKRWRIETETNTQNQPTNQVGIIPDEIEAVGTEQENVYSVSVSPGGELATVGESEVVQLWDSNSNKVVRTLEPWEGSLSDSQTRSVAFSPDGKQIATLGSDSTVRLWDTSGKRLLRFPTHDDETNTIAFSRDGKLLATAGVFGDERNITLFDPLSGRVINYVTTDQDFRSLIFLPGNSDKEEQLAAIDQDGAVLILTVMKDENNFKFAVNENQQLIFQSISAEESGLQPYGFNGDTKIESLVFSADERYAAAVQNNGNVEIRGADLTLLLPTGSAVSSIAISPDNQQIATAGEDGIVHLWNIQNLPGSESDQQTQPIELNTQQGGITSLTFNPLNSSQLVTGGEDGTVRFWDLSRNQPTQISLLAEGELKAVATSANGDCLATLSEKGVLNLWNMEDGTFRASSFSAERLNQRQNLLGAVKTLLLSPMGDHLAIISADGDALLWNIKNDQWNIKNDQYTGFISKEQDPVKSIEFAPGEDRLVAIRAGRIENWMLGEDGQWQPLNPTQNIQSNEQSQDEQQSDATQDILSNEQKIVSVAFNPIRSEGSTLPGSRIDLATLSKDGTVKLWDAEGKLMKTLFKTDQENPHILAFSPDGTRLATGAAEDEETSGTVRVWDIKGKQIQQFGELGDDVKSVIFSQDARHLAIVASRQPSQESSNNQETFMVFDVDNNPREPINPQNTQQGTIANAMFTSDGQLATLSRTGQMSLWQMSDSKLQEEVCQLVWNYIDPDVQKDLCEEVSAPLVQSISAGEKVLIPSNPSAEKLAGIQAIASGDLATAIQRLEASLESRPNDPEVRIYLNNAQIGSQPSYTIAVPVPIGTNVDAAEEILRGVAQAQQEINEQEGINGKRLRVMIANDNDDPEIAQQIAQQLIDDPEIEGVVGHYASDTTKAANKIYEKGKLVSISPVSTAIDLFKADLFGNSSPYAFRTVPSDQMAAQRLADYTVQQEKNKAVVFYNSNSTYSKSITQAYTDALEENGGSVIKIDLLKKTDFNAAQEVEKILEQSNAANDTAIVLFPNSGILGKSIEVMQENYTQSRNASHPPLLMLGGDDVYSPTVLKNAGEAAVGLVVAVPWHINRYQDDQPFVKSSLDLWDATVNWRTAMAYDAVMALAEGLYDNPTREKLAEALRANDFKAPGATSKVKFEAGLGNREQPSELVYVVRPCDGKSLSGTGFDFDVNPGEPCPAPVAIPNFSLSVPQ